MQIILSPNAKAHLDFWVKNNNRIVLGRIAQLTRAIVENPYKGVGKPEPLKYELSGYWSRRITKEHRFVYAIADNTLLIVSLKGHY